MVQAEGVHVSVKGSVSYCECETKTKGVCLPVSVKGGVSSCVSVKGGVSSCVSVKGCVSSCECERVG